MSRSNYFKAHTIRNEGVAQEQVCRVCRGTGEDPVIPEADCLECWGEGTVEFVSDNPPER